MTDSSSTTNHVLPGLVEKLREAHSQCPVPAERSLYSESVSRIEQIETWISQWVATAEYQGDNGAVEMYAGWLSVADMPARVVELLNIDEEYLDE